MRTSKVKPKRKFIYKPTIIKVCFKRKGQLDTSYIHKEYNRQIGHDENHRLNAGGYYYVCNTNPMFTSRNSHKQTNKRK